MDVARLPQAQRLALAGVQGVARRYTAGTDRDRPRAEAIAAVHSETADPMLLGLAAGAMAADPQRSMDSAVALLLEAGADPAVAAQHELEVRGRLEATGVRYAGPPYPWGDQSATQAAI